MGNMALSNIHRRGQVIVGQNGQKIIMYMYVRINGQANFCVASSNNAKKKLYVIIMILTNFQSF